MMILTPWNIRLFGRQRYGTRFTEQMLPVSLLNYSLCC